MNRDSMETTLNSSKKIPKLKSLTGATVSPLSTDSSSRLMKYLCYGGGAGNVINESAFSPPSIAAAKSSRAFGRSPFSPSPLSSIENVMMMTSPSSSCSSSKSVVYRTPPMKVVDDDVLVVDGYSLSSVSSKGSRVSRNLTSDSGGDPSFKTSSSSSCSSPDIHQYKMDLCRSWENSGHCRYGSKCQFAHGKEELRPTSFCMNSKPEIHSSFRLPSARSYAQALTPRSPPPPPDMKGSANQKAMAINESEYPILISPSNKSLRKPRTLTNPEELSKNSITLAKPGELSKKTTLIIDQQHSKQRSTIETKHQDWSPLEDGIEVVLPGDVATKSQTSRKDVDAHIEKVLYGPRTRKRLPVFTEFCPE